MQPVRHKTASCEIKSLYLGLSPFFSSSSRDFEFKLFTHSEAAGTCGLTEPLENAVEFNDEALWAFYALTLIAAG